MTRWVEWSRRASQWRWYLSRAYEQETPGQNVEAESQLMAADGFGSLSRDTFSGSETWPGRKIAGRMRGTKVQSGKSAGWAVLGRLGVVPSAEWCHCRALNRSLCFKGSPWKHPKDWIIEQVGVRETHEEAVRAIRRRWCTSPLTRVATRDWDKQTDMGNVEVESRAAMLVLMWAVSDGERERWCCGLLPWCMVSVASSTVLGEVPSGLAHGCSRREGSVEGNLGATPREAGQEG